jgi:DNA-binding transcriptional ArsR family regulator
MQDHLSATFAALADPTRRAILARLAMGETTVSELAEPFVMSMPAVSKHLKVLERAGLIARRLKASPLKEAASWIEEYRRFWTPYIDALERHLDRMKLGEQTKKSSTTKRRVSKNKPRKGQSK